MRALLKKKNIIAIILERIINENLPSQRDMHADFNPVTVDVSMRDIKLKQP